MQTLGVSGGWMFFEHAGNAVAVDLATGDVTDVLSKWSLDDHVSWTAPGHTAEERRATLLARSALATSVDPLQMFTVPRPVRDNARQAQDWAQVYDRPIELPLIAAGASLLPPSSVRGTAHSVIDADLGPSDRARAEHLASGLPVNPRIVQQMNVYFSRHPKETADPKVWASWGGDPGRVWASKVASAAKVGASTIEKRLAEDEQIDYDTLRLMPRAFSVLNGPHTADCDGNGSCSCGGSKSSARYPSSRALTYLALGGDAGRAWATRTARRVEAASLMANGYDADANVAVEDEVPDAESFDGEAPHVFAPVTENPDFCMFCALDEMDERHQADAVDYTNADITPEDAHYFSETVKDSETCEICGKAVDDTLHKQAALAAYYLHKDDVDKKIAETQQYWAGKAGEGEQPTQPITSAADIHGVDWEEFDSEDPVERAIAADDDLNKVFWERRGSEDDDPLTYYAAYTGDDSMLVDQLYMTDGAMFYRYEPSVRTWEQTQLDSPQQLIELDDETARSVVRAMSVYPDQQVDLREVDPGEALLMQEAIPGLDDEMLDRLAIVTASAVVFDYIPLSAFADDGYTPEERAANAKKQVRDAGGRFAKSGSKIAVGPNARTGTVAKIDPATQQVQVTYDDDGSSEWVPAKSTRVTAPPAPTANPDVIDLNKIQGKPRATGRTPKATLPMMLPQMDAQALAAVVENYPNFIEHERAGAAARQRAQQTNDRQSQQRYQREQAKADSDYKRRLERIHAQGKSARDWIDRIYRKILPGYKRRPSNPLTATLSLDFASKKKDAPAAEAVPAAAQPITDPAQSDVAPVYMAEVDEANQQAVLELLAMVPATSTGTNAQVLRYTATGWVSDPKILRQLQSSAPPAIVSLDEATFNDTLAQVKNFYTTPEGKAEAIAEAKDAESQVAAATLYGEYGEVVEIAAYAALSAAGIPGIADTPSDIVATEKLKQYWTVGRGGAKIRWNTPGDMTRCMRHLRKYMPRKAMHAGYCANLHHEMTGTWPGDRRNVGRRGSATRGSLFDVMLLNTDEVIDVSAMVASANALCAGVEAPGTVEEVPTELSGAPFVIPVLAPVGIKSGDGRHFAPLSLTTRDLPLPLMWQIQTAEGHDASVIVGRIDSIDRSEDGSLVNARGVFDVGPYGQEAERLVRHKFLRGVSVDLDNFEAEARSKDSLIEHEKREGHAEDDIVRIVADDMTVTNGRVMGATLVAKPAFQEVRIELEEGTEEEAMVADGTYIGTPNTEAETEEMVRSALTAAGIPVHPPKSWFEDQGLQRQTPFTVLDDGRVFGHIATWDSDHIGLPFSTRPPRSRSNYAYFHTGLLRTDDDSDVTVGQVTLSGGHAPLEANAAAAVKHYDDTSSAFCDVHAGEDIHGIWVAGALRPSVTAEQVRAIRAAAPSGDWRPINGRLEMVAVCQVNVPGFPVTRARVASGQVFALVAAGTATLSRLRAEADDSPLGKLLTRVDALEAPQRAALSEARAAAMARISPVREERNAQLAAARSAALERFGRVRAPQATEARERVAALMSGGDAYFRDIGTDKRKELAKEGKAMPGGGYPISTVGDLKNAIRAYGRAASGEKAKVRRHIKKRARALGKTDLIPESWASLTTPVQDVAGEILDLAERMALVSAGACIPILTQHPEVLDEVELLADGAPTQSVVAEETEAAEITSLEALFGRGPGWVTNPKGTKRLHDYWIHGKGAAKIRWGQPGDFDRCRKQVGEEIGEGDPGKLRFINQICAQWHKDATKATPGNAPAERGHSTIEFAEHDEFAGVNELIAAGGRYPDGSPWDPNNHPRDEKGRFRLVIAELRKDLEGEAGTQQAVEGLNEVEQAANQGDTEAAQQAAKGVLDIVDRIAKNTENEGAVKTLREGYTNLAEAVANLPLVFGDLNQKYRFSDLPTDLKGLITDLYKRAEQRLDPEHLDEAGGKLKEFMSGIDVLSQPQISAELSRILRFLI